MKKLLFFSLLPFFVMSQTQIGNDIDGENAGDCSGVSVALSSDGNVLAVASPCYKSTNLSRIFGKVRVLKNVSGFWTPIGDNIYGKFDEYYFGMATSLSSDGKFLAVSNTGYNSSLPSYTQVYENISGVWTQIGNDINGSCGYSSLSSDGSTISVANPDKVIIYRNVSGVWTQIGNSIEAQDASLSSISSDGTILAVGFRFPNFIDDGSAKTKVIVYKNISGIWTQIGTGEEGEILGNGRGMDMSISLSSDGSILAFGAPPYGSVRIFKNISEGWTQIGQSINGNEFNNSDYFGFRVSLSADGTIVAIGARDNGLERKNGGYVKLFKNESGIWTQIGSDIISEARNDASAVGLSLSSDGTKLAIGAPGNDGNGETSGNVRVFDLSGILSSDSFVLENFKIYPNPVSEILTVELQNFLKLQKVIIYNTLGQVIQTETTKTINVSSLVKGSYYAEVITNKGKATKTIIIK